MFVFLSSASPGNASSLPSSPSTKGKGKGRRGNVSISQRIGLLPRRVEYTQLFATLLSVAYDREFSDIANAGAIQFGYKGR